MILNEGLGGIITLGAIIGIVGVIALVSYIVYRVTHPKLKEKAKEINEEEVLKEEMDRLLTPVDDEETARQIENYKETDE